MAIIKAESRFKDRQALLLLSIIGLAYCALFIALGLARLYGLKSSLADLGVFDQAFWLMLHHGRPFATFAHFSPILYVLLPFYAMFPHPETLLVLSVLLLTSTIIPLYCTARHWHISPLLSVAWCMVFLCNPYVLSAIIWDFREICLAAPILSFALYAIATRKISLLLLMCCLLLLCKEHYGLSVSGMGLLWAIWHKDRRTGCYIFIGGVVAFLLILTVLMPIMNGHAFMGWSANSSQMRYKWLTHPGSLSIEFVLAIAFLAAAYGIKLVGQFWFLPLLSFAWLLPAGGDVLMNMLDSTGVMQSQYLLHTATVIPVLTIAAMQGGMRLVRKRRGLKFSQLTYLVLATNMALGYISAPLPLPGAVDLWELKPADMHMRYRQDIDQIKTMLPADKFLSAQYNVGSFFSQRPYIYSFPLMLDSADAIVLHLETPYRNKTAVVGSPFEILAPEYIATIHALLMDKTWGIIYWHDHWLVLERNKRGISVDKAEIEAALAGIQQHYSDAQMKQQNR